MADLPFYSNFPKYFIHLVGLSRILVDWLSLHFLTIEVRNYRSVPEIVSMQSKLFYSNTLVPLVESTYLKTVGGGDLTSIKLDLNLKAEFLDPHILVYFQHNGGLIVAILFSFLFWSSECLRAPDRFTSSQFRTYKDSRRTFHLLLLQHMYVGHFHPPLLPIFDWRVISIFHHCFPSLIEGLFHIIIGLDALLFLSLNWPA